MTVETLDQHIEITPEVLGGKPRIAGRRIAVQDVVIWHERVGLSADEIATNHSLSLADVYAALAYYYDHQAEIDDAIQDTSEFVEALRQAIPSKVTQKLDAQPL
jgi:uncharacterized protein (DUF433 family)